MYSKYPFGTFNVTWNEIIEQYDPDTVNAIVDINVIKLIARKMINCSYWALPYHLNPSNKASATLFHAGVLDVFNTKTPDEFNDNLIKALTASVTIDTNKWSRRNTAILARLRLFKGFGQVLSNPRIKQYIVTGHYNAFSFIPGVHESVIRWYSAGYGHNFDRRVFFHPFESYYTLIYYEILDRLQKRVRLSTNTNFKGDVKNFKSDALICFLLEHRYYGFNGEHRETNVELFKKHFGSCTPFNIKKERLNFHLKTYNIRSVYNGVTSYNEELEGNRRNRMHSITTYTRNSKVV